MGNLEESEITKALGKAKKGRKENKMKKINVSNEAKLNGLIEKEQIRCTARIIDYEDITKIVTEIEKELELLLPKTAWVGVNIHVDLHAQSFPGAYKYSPESTQFIVARGSSDWFIIGLGRAYTCSPTNRMRVVFTDIQKEKMIEFVTKNF